MSNQIHTIQNTSTEEQQQHYAYPPPNNGPIQQRLTDAPIEFPRQPKFNIIPIECICPFCQKRVITGTNYCVGVITWLVCIIFICFGLILGCCLIPFYVDAFKDVEHVCPNCLRTIHVYDRIKGN